MNFVYYAPVGCGMYVPGILGRFDGLIALDDPVQASTVCRGLTVRIYISAYPYHPDQCVSTCVCMEPAKENATDKEVT